MKYLRFALLLLLFPITLSAQIFEKGILQIQTQTAVDHVYNLEFEAAEKIALELRKNYPQHPIPHFILGLNKWWQNFLSEKTNLYYTYIHLQLDSSLLKNKAFREKPRYKTQYTFLQFMAYALKAKAYAAQDEWWSAANAARKLISYLKQGFKLMDDQVEFYFSSGIYHYYAEIYPQHRPITKPFMIFFPNGDAQKGLQELEKAASVVNLAQAEALFYLGYIYLDDEKQPAKGLKATRMLVQQYPNNTWFQADYAHALVYNQQFDEAEKILRQLSIIYEKQPQAFTQNITSAQSRYTSQVMLKVYLYQGKSRFYQHKYDEALVLLDQSFLMAKLSDIKVRDYLAAATYYKARCYDAKGDREQAIIWYKKVLDMDENTLVRAEAKRCLRDGCGSSP